MPRQLSLTWAVPAAFGLMLLYPLYAAAAPTAVTSSPPSHAITRASALTPSLSSPTAACAFPTVRFNGASYCPATIVGVRNTVYGLGTRVVLKGVTVTAVTTTTVTVAVWTSPPCPPGKYCGQVLTLENLTVPWTGTSRPAYGDVLDLFGPTITASITPVGYLKTGFCPIDWC